MPAFSGVHCRLKLGDDSLDAGAQTVIIALGLAEPLVKTHVFPKTRLAHGAQCYSGRLLMVEVWRNAQIQVLSAQTFADEAL